MTFPDIDAASSPAAATRMKRQLAEQAMATQMLPVQGEGNHEGAGD